MALDVIDADSHLTEVPTLWLDRLPRKWADEAPRVELHEPTQTDRWRIGDQWVMGAGSHSLAGWDDFPASTPRRWEEVAPENYDVSARVRWMDEHGITAQVLYPNLVAFEGHAFMALKDPALRLACIRAQNDYLRDFAASAPGRFVLLANLPFWDLEESVEEMRRCAALGFTGVVWAATLDRHGLPATTDPYWDAFYAEAQDLEMSISFHVGVGFTEGLTQVMARPVAGTSPAPEGRTASDGDGGDPADMVYRTTLGFMSNARTIAKLILHQVCHRFPRLKFVSVESGFGFVPFVIEALDWQWKNLGGSRHTDLLLPSEYFRRQIYTTFWFERATLSQLSVFPENTMFETDMPHPTSLTPGKGSAAESPRFYVAAATQAVGPEITRKVVYENAARLYRYSPPAAAPRPAPSTVVTEPAGDARPAGW